MAWLQHKHLRKSISILAADFRLFIKYAFLRNVLPCIQRDYRQAVVAERVRTVNVWVPLG